MYRLLKDIGYYPTGMELDRENEEYTLTFLDHNIPQLIEQGYIEEVQEPWATDKDMIEFAYYAAASHHQMTYEGDLQQFKKERETNEGS
jgi:hypothetical protein